MQHETGRILALLLGLSLGGCGASEDAIKAEFDALVEESNSCEAAEQCAHANAGCPLGCSRAVRVDRVAAVERKAAELIADYERGGRSCDYECTVPGALRCEHGRCTASPPAPDQACTAIGCAPPFTVHFAKATPWPSGHYEVLVTLDDQPTACTADIPLRCDAPPACPGNAVQLQLSGCALAPASHAITGVDLLTPAQSVHIDITGPSGPLAQGAWQPSYTSSTPNGPQCQPTCTGAPTEDLSF